MKLSSRSRHAINAMLELAVQGGQSETPIVDMAKKYEISQSSMEQLFAKLKFKELVNGRRGRRGGYRLGREPEEITIAEIVSAVDCEKMGGQTSSEAIAPNQRKVADVLWRSLSDRLFDFLGKITLADLVAERQVIVSNVIADDADNGAADDEHALEDEEMKNKSAYTTDLA